MRMRKKKNLVPRMEACGALLLPTPAAAAEQKGRWRETLMPQAKELHLELGCGKGRFTAETAAQNPDILFIAIERVPDAMVIAMERCQAQGLTNVFFIDDDAVRLPLLFAPGEVDRIYINFCDPWPGQHHARRRLTSEGFLRVYRQILKEGGQIHFKTDNHDLFEWSLFQFPKVGFSLSEVTRNLHEHGIQGVMTDYEEKFHAMGTPINRCVGTMEALPDLEVVPAYTRRRDVAALFAEYTDMLIAGDSAFRQYLDAQHYEEEAAHLEAKYGTPDGRLYLACWNGVPAGCIGLRKIDRENCEMKRLYVRPEFRGKQIGARLIQKIIEDAKEIGYSHMLLDTLPFLESALHIYKKHGFYEIESYNDSPMESSIYMRLDL